MRDTETKLELLPYQTEGVRAILEILARRPAAYLGDEMGLGKTIQADAVRQGLQAKSCLVICPAILRSNWVREFIRWGNLPALDYPLSITKGDGKTVKAIKIHNIVVTSFDMTRSHSVLDALERKYWDLLILDEAHKLSNRKAQMTYNCLTTLWRRAEKKLLLSGTPVRNEIIDAFTTFNACAPDIFPAFWTFARRYTGCKRGHWGWDFSGGKNLPELRQKIRASFFIRRTKKQVLEQLPDKQYSMVRLPVVYKSTLTPMEREAAKLAIDRDELPAMTAHYMTERRLLGEAKADAVVEYLTELTEHKNRLVVFAYHRGLIDDLTRKAQPLGTVLTIHGGTPMDVRQKAIDLFQSDAPETIILVGQITAAGVGITLTAADTCVFPELSLSPVENSQAVDRLHRIGQKNNVQCHILIGEGTIDEDISESLVKKMKNMKEVLR